MKSFADVMKKAQTGVQISNEPGKLSDAQDAQEFKGPHKVADGLDAQESKQPYRMSLEEHSTGFTIVDGPADTVITEPPMPDGRIPIGMHLKGVSQKDMINNNIEWKNVAFTDVTNFNDFVKAVSTPEFNKVASYYAESTKLYASLDQIKSSEAREGRRAAIEEQLAAKYGGNDFARLMASPEAKLYNDFAKQLSTGANMQDRADIHAGILNMSNLIRDNMSGDTITITGEILDKFNKQMSDTFNKCEDVSINPSVKYDAPEVKRAEKAASVAKIPMVESPNDAEDSYSLSGMEF